MTTIDALLQLSDAMAPSPTRMSSPRCCGVGRRATRTWVQVRPPVSSASSPKACAEVVLGGSTSVAVRQLFLCNWLGQVCDTLRAAPRFPLFIWPLHSSATLSFSRGGGLIMVGGASLVVAFSPTAGNHVQGETCRSSLGYACTLPICASLSSSLTSLSAPAVLATHRYLHCPKTSFLSQCCHISWL